MVATEEHVKGFEKEFEVVKDITPSDSRPEEKYSEHDGIKNVSSKGIPSAQHKRPREEDRENFEEKSEKVGQVSRAVMKERKRAPLTQFNKWSSSNVANPCAIQISLESLRFLRGVAPSLTPKCV